MPGKPLLTVFAVHEAHLRSIMGLDSALERDDNARTAVKRWRYENWGRHGARIDCEKHALHLRVDVHPGHAGGCGLLVVRDASVDVSTRLAALHARRAGLHRFVLLVDDRGPPGRVDSAEHDARELLCTLGVDGDAVPAVRAPLHDHVVDVEAQAAGMRDLLAALDDLPADLEPELLHTTPPGFAAEAELLDALAPLFAPITYIAVDWVDRAATLALRGGDGGSHEHGVPYLERDEAWPECPDCRRLLSIWFQFDARDFQHPAPPGHGLFVVFSCPRCPTRVIRHHPAPAAERRRRDEVVVGAASERPRIFVPDGMSWSLPGWRQLPHTHPEVVARMQALVGDEDPEAAACRVLQALGANYSRAYNHFGGHHESEHAAGLPAPRCGRCGAVCPLFVHVDHPGVYNDRASLWACREHPDEAVIEVHA